MDDKKWFVKRKTSKRFLFTKGGKLNYVSGKINATYFDTKARHYRACDTVLFRTLPLIASAAKANFGTDRAGG